MDLMPQPRTLFNDRDEPAISLPPPVSRSNRIHPRSRTSVDLASLSGATSYSTPSRASPNLLPHQPSRIGRPDPIGPDPVDTKDHTSHRRAKSGAVGKIVSLFEAGTSDSVNISLLPSPMKEKEEPFYQLDIEQRASMPMQDNLTVRPSQRPPSSPPSSNSSVFSFFKRTGPTSSAKVDPGAIAQVDVTKALFPNGPVEQVTPAAFKALQQNAEALAKQLQSSNALGQAALRQATSQRDASNDELEASQTRNEHLKMQLVEMAERAADQEKTIAALKEELVKHQQSIRLVSEDDYRSSRSKWQRKRISDVSASDESFHDSDISSANSIFSEVESVRDCSPATSVAPSPVLRSARLCSPILKAEPILQSQTTPVLVAECSNCHGVGTSEAWQVIDVMKAESLALKQRVVELENAQDAALDFLSGLKL